MKKQKEKYRYIFPNPMAKAMANISFQTQMESALFSTFLLMIGLSLMAIYLAFFTQNLLVYKIIILFNLSCGWLLMGSNLVTTYNQYVSFMEASGMPSKDEHKAEIRKRGNIFKRIFLAIRMIKKRKQEDKEKLVKIVKKNKKVKEIAEEVPTYEESIKSLEKEGLL